MSPYVLLAKLAVESFVKEGRIISPPEDLPEEFLNQKSGTFVSIFRSPREKTRNKMRNHAKKELRGCIGTYLPTKENIVQEIIQNAITAASEDYRFGPIQEEELPHLNYTVYILSKPEIVKSISELNPKKYGVIVKTLPIVSPEKTDVVFNGHVPAKTGLLLPDLEGIDTVEKQISIACRKGGIDLLKEKIIIYRFEVEKYQ